ncbi:MFS transporter [Candidatus Stoquefichus massiliensis]|uniref:MFS transporter n=1 Tax=Candidatus Stoquefichus massiliensis TaxID=1470350 RepID=UPI000485C911|nr:MFS transporter [Candidatus Stoquefichus massiliensis]
MKILKQYQGLRKEIYVLTFGKVVTCLGAMVWPMMTLILSSKLKMDASHIASLLLIMNIIQIPCMMFAGYIADHFNKKMIIIFCDLVTVAGYLLIALLDINMSTIIIFFIAGLFAMMEHPAYDALIADLSHSNDRERAYSLTYLGANLGMVLAPMIGGLLFAEHLQLSFFIDALSTLASTIMIILMVKDVSVVKSQSDEKYEEAQSGGLWKVLKTRKVLVFYLCCFIVIEFIYSQYQFLLPLNLEQLYGQQGALYFGAMTSLNAIVVVIGTPLLTAWFHRMSDLNKIWISTVLFMLSLSMYIFIQGMIPLYFISMFIFTCGEIFNALGQLPFVTKRIPLSHRGRMNSLQRMLSAIFIAVMQKGVGVLIDHHTMVFMWTLVSILTVIGVMMISVLKKMDQKEYPLLQK